MPVILPAAPAAHARLGGARAEASTSVAQVGHCRFQVIALTKTEGCRQFHRVTETSPALSGHEIDGGRETTLRVHL